MELTIKCPLCEATLTVEIGARGDFVRKLAGNRLLNILKSQHEEGKHGDGS